MENLKSNHFCRSHNEPKGRCWNV